MKSLTQFLYEALEASKSEIQADGYGNKFMCLLRNEDINLDHEDEFIDRLYKDYLKASEDFWVLKKSKNKSYNKEKQKSAYDNQAIIALQNIQRKYKKQATQDKHLANSKEKIVDDIKKSKQSSSKELSLFLSHFLDDNGRVGTAYYWDPSKEKLGKEVYQDLTKITKVDPNKIIGYEFCCIVDKDDTIHRNDLYILPIYKGFSNSDKKELVQQVIDKSLESE